MKIPLFDKQIQVRTARAVEPDYNLAPKLAEAQSKAEKATTDGVFKIIEEGIGLGSEYLKEKEKLRIENNNNSYELAEKEIPNKIRDLKTQGAEEGKNEQQTYDDLIKPYLDGFLDEWGKDEKNMVTKDIQDKYNITKAEAEESNLLELDGIAQSQNLTSGLKIAQSSANNFNMDDDNPFLESDTKIDSFVGKKPEEKSAYKRNIRKTALDLNLDSATTEEDIDKLIEFSKKISEKDESPYTTQDYLDFKSKAETAKSNLYNSKTKPFVNDVSEQLKNGNFSMLDKKEDGSYINAEIDALDDVSKRTLEGVAKTVRMDFESFQSSRDITLNSEAQGRLYLDDLITKYFDPNTPTDELDDIHADILKELLSEKLDKNDNPTGKFAYPQFFVTETLQSMQYRIGTNGLDIGGLPPESEDGGYIYGVNQFNKEFNNIFSELDSNIYLQQYNEAHDSFYSELRSAVKTIRKSKEFKEAETGSQAAILRTGIKKFIGERFADIRREQQLFRTVTSLSLRPNILGITDENAVNAVISQDSDDDSIQDKAGEVKANVKIMSADERRRAKNKKKQGQND